MFCPTASLAISTGSFLQQIIVGGVANTPEDVQTYASCTLLASSLKESKWEKGKEQDKAQAGPIEACVAWLLENEFIQVVDSGIGVKGKVGVSPTFDLLTK